MKSNAFLRFLVLMGFCVLLPKVEIAQMGHRYAEPVFEAVNVVKDIPYSSAIREGQTTPTTLYLDFY